MSRTFTLDFNKAQLKEMEEGVSLTVPTGSIFTVRPSAFNITPDARGISVENRDKVSVIFEVAGTMPAGTVIDLELFARVYRVAIGTVTKTTAVAYTDELVQLDIEDPLLSEADYVRITYKFKQGTAYTVSRLFANVKKKLTSLTESAMEWKGVWNANTNTPALASGVGTNGDTYRVSVAGSTNLDGITDWKVGDWAIFNGGTVTWEKADNTDAVSSVHGRIGAVVAAASDYDASQIDNDSGVVGATVKAALDTLRNSIVIVDDSVVLTAADSHKVYATVAGTGTDPITFTLPTSGAAAGIRFLFFNAAEKGLQLLCSGAEDIRLKTSGLPPTKIQANENLSFIEIVSSGLGLWVIASASGKWFNADAPAEYRLFDGSIQDGVGGQIYDTEFGGHVFKTLAQRARGTIDFPGGVPIADETFVLNATTLTWKADGSGNEDHVTIGANAGECVTNLVTTLAECKEKNNLTGWDGAGDTVVVEWGTAGVVGNGITFSETCTNMTMDGGGTLGGTHAGVAAATLLVIGEDGAVDIPGSASIGANTAITDSAVTTNQLAIINSNYGTIKSSTDDGLMVAIGAGAGQGNRNLIFADSANRSKDHDHDTLSANPTEWWHSVRDPDESNTEWMSRAMDGDNAVYGVGKGGHTFTTAAQKARGTMTLTGIPVADETFVINATTLTAKADGSGDVDWFTIGVDATATVANIVATLAECSESGNLTAWDGAGDTVVIEWGTAGVVGNGIVLTSGLTNCSVDGGGTLGGTHAGIEAATLLDIDEGGPASIKYPLRGATSLWKNYRQLGANSIGIGVTGATYVPPDAAGANATIGGWLLDNTPSAEYLYFEFDVHDDWDGASDITVNVFFEQETAGGGAGQTTVLDLELYYKQPNESTSKGQSLTATSVTGASGVKTQWKQVFTIDYNPGGGMDVEANDLFTGRVWWDNVTSTDATHPIINHIEIEYLTKQPALEA